MKYTKRIFIRHVSLTKLFFTIKKFVHDRESSYTATRLARAVHAITVTCDGWFFGVIQL